MPSRNYLKNVEIYNEGWIADCVLCGESLLYARTKESLMRGLKERRDEHLAEECGAVNHFNIGYPST